MVTKERICRAFCEGVQVSSFNGGFAISTSYLNGAGDRIGVYALGNELGPYKLIDNALTVAFLEAEGLMLDSASRRSALEGILAEYGASYDEDMGEVFVDNINEHDLPKAILDFSALLLRLNDMLLLTVERVKNAFEDDVRSALRAEMSKRNIRVEENQPVSDNLQDIAPDMVFFPEGRDPVALFVATNESKLWQAMHLRLIADYEQHFALSVAAILETDTSVSQKARNQADNRLDALPRYRSGPIDSIQRIVRLTAGNQSAALQ